MLNRSGSMEDALKLLYDANSSTNLLVAVRSLETSLSACGCTQSQESTRPRKVETTAKALGPGIAQMLKFCFGKLNVVGNISQEDSEKASLYAAAAILGVDTLSTLQGLRPLEVEIQRYNLIRRLVSWQKHGTALLQGWILFSSLCWQVADSHAKNEQKKVNMQNGTKSWNMMKAGLPRLIAGTSAGTLGNSAEDFIALGVVELQSPELREANEMVTLVVGSILNLLICLPETTPLSLTALQRLLPALQKLEMWISKLDVVTASKHRDSLFRCLYKCTSQLLHLTEPEASSIHLSFQYSTLALEACRKSSSEGRYMQVALKLCRGLTDRDLALGLQLHEACLSGRFAPTQVPTSSERAALLASYTQSCNDLGVGEQGCQVLKSLAKTYQMAGLCILPLLLNSELEHATKVSKRGQKKASKPGLQEHVSCFQRALSAVKDLLQGPDLRSTSDTEATATFMAETEIISSTSILELLRKAISSHVEDQWQAWLASESSGRQSISNKAEVLQDAMDESLRVWQTALEVLCRLGKTSKPSLDASTRLASSVPSVLTTKMRLSLMDVGRDQQKVLDELQPASNSQIEQLSEMGLGRELRMLSSSMYNLGVQLFNQQQYDMAKHPLSVASRASWARANVALSSDPSSEQSASDASSETKQSQADVIHDACSKTASHADCVRREGDVQAAVDALVPGFRALCERGGALPVASLQVLVKQLVKIQTLDLSFFVHNHLHQQLVMDKSHMSSIQIGLAFEEMLAGLQAEEVKAFIPVASSLINLLLTSVYARSGHPIRRARLLMEQARLLAAEDVPSCIGALEEAIRLQDAVMKDARKAGEDTDLLASLQDECALAKCHLALVKQQTDPHQDLEPTVRVALQLWMTLLEKDGVNGGSFFSPAASQSALLQLADLFAFKGLQLLQQEALQLAVLIAQAVSPSTPLPQHLAALLSNSRASHLFCCNTLPSHCFQKSAQHNVESNRKTDSFWEDAAALCPGSLLEAKVKPAAECCCTESPSTSGRDDVSTSPVQQLRDIIAHNASGSRRSVSELVKQGGLQQLLAERLLSEGRRDEALCEATEALRIRFGLFGHTFGTAKGGEAEAHLKESQPQSKSTILTPTGRAGWISLYSQKAASGSVSVLHNPWRIVGDYLESLLLVGTISESAGMVDDAEQNFREGRRVAEAVGASHAEAEFHSAMGEVKRKKGNWEAAKEAFERARRLLLVDCEGCQVLALARLERREGDLIRRQPESVPGERRSAGEYYERAAKLLRGILGSGSDKGLGDRTGSLVEVGLGSESGEGEDGSMGGVKRNLMGAMAAAEPTKGHVAAVKRRPVRKGKPKLEPLAEAPVIPKKGRQSRKKAVEVITVLSSDDESRISEAQTHAPKLRGPVRGRVHKLAQESSTSELESEASSTTVARPKQLRGKKLRRTAGGSDAASESSPPPKTGRRAAHADLDKTQEKLRRVVPFEKESVLPALRGSRFRGPVSNAAEMEALRTGLGRISLNEAKAAGTDPQTKGLEGGFKPWLPGAREELGRVLLQQGKCCSSPEDARDLFLRGLALVRACSAAKSSFANTPTAHHPLTEAALLYHLGQLTHSPSIYPQLSSPLAMLTRAYDLCTSAPLLFRKVALQLAVLHSTPMGDALLGCHVAPDPRLAAYYHQAAVGASSVQQHLAIVDMKLVGLSRTADMEDQQASTGDRAPLEDLHAALRIPPLSLIDWKADFQTRILNDLPPGCAVCCISLVRNPNPPKNPSNQDAAEPAGSATSSDPSLLITRITSDKSRKPVSVLLPIPVCLSESGSSTEPDLHGGISPERLRRGHTSAYDELSDEESATGDDVAGDVALKSALDEVLECFSGIMEGSRRSTSGEVDTAAQKKRWWQWRLTLDKNLGTMLQTMEDTWLGPWRCLLLGEPPNPQTSTAFLRAATDLKKRMDAAKQGRAEWAASLASGPCVDLELVRLLLQGVHALPDRALESAVAELLGWSAEVAETAGELRERSVRKARVRTRGGKDSDATNESEEESSGRESGDEDGSEGLELRQAKLVMKLADEFRRMATEAGTGGGHAKGGGKAKGARQQSRKAAVESDAKGEAEERLPVLLVLDADLQALPWESLPLLRTSRAYRAPSVASIRALLARCRHQSHGMEPDGTERRSAGFTVDASNAFYLLNPSGDLEATQASFEHWFRSQKGWQGLINRAPSVDQLLSALEAHDLFVYLGHGSGEQFLPSRSFRRLQHCATALLMGCSSGKLTLRGDFEPSGSVFSYLMAGSSAAVANLWDVTDGDIDRFSKTVLQQWLQSESSDDTDSGEESGGSRKAVGQPPRSSAQAQFEVPPADKCISAVVAAGRTACILPFLIGAAPVCYGVPTGFV